MRVRLLLDDLFQIRFSMFNNVMNNKAKLLISECLCGVSCRYDGKDNLIEQLPLLKDTFDLVTVCP